MADYNLARAYIAAHGDPLELARIDAAISYPEAPALSAAARDVLRDGRLPDGAAQAPWSAGTASIESTASMLGIVDELKLDEDATADYLARAQGEDGSFVETAPGAPQWLARDEPDAVIFLTAYVAHRLGRHGKHGDAVYRAVDFLAPHLGSMPVGYLPTYWYAASAYAALGDLPSAEAMLTKVAPDVEDIGPTALASLGCAVGWSSVASGVRFRLTWRQEPDGRWASEHGTPADVVTTIEATRALAIGSYLERDQ
ncbi:hypothetical protein CLV47_11499 [Antricoccus suffuscus]|uniref:Prenyltransferase/squalene oxidase-like repeat protein n=1 Tax=Antricoccus suffuscus TaxID=1629062 RepID=A0A2T0ZWS1_9ACTN|nr:hypothetical protein [Antricoccus suffuscus]PRZ40802.1 hypothetical protein CLV47_11499 [Antricoccus suffuscus]